MQVTLTLEIPASSREALQQILDTVTTYDLIGMATSMSEVIDPLPLVKGLLEDEHAAHGDIVTITPLQEHAEEPEPSDAAQVELLESWFPWLGSDQDQSGADTIDRLVEWYEAVGGEFNSEDDNED